MGTQPARESRQQPARVRPEPIGERSDAERFHDQRAAPQRRELTSAEPEAPVIPARVPARWLTLTILTALVAVFALQYAQVFFIPVVLAILIAYALDPIVSALTRVKVPRAIAAALVVLSITAASAWAAYRLADDAAALVQQLPQAAQKLRQAIRTYRRDGPTAIEHVQEAAKELEKTAAEAAGAPPAPPGVTRVQIEEPAFDRRQYLLWGSMSLMEIGSELVLLLFLVFFLLASGDSYKRKLVKIGGKTLAQKKITLEILDDINRQIERFLLVQAFTSFLVGVLSYAAFRWFGLHQAAIWAIAAGLFNTVPYLGPVVVTGGVFIVAFLQFGTIGQAVAVALSSLAITSVEGLLLTPWLTSRAAKMNAVAVFIGLLFWTWVWGVWGTLLAVPMLMVVKAVCDRIEDLKPIGELVGE